MPKVAKPTASDVRVVITTKLTDDQINVIISDASLLARRCLLPLDSETQTAMLRWLAAHMIAVVKNQGGGGVTSRSLGDASKSFSTAGFGDRLGSTSYGQNALMLDPNGCLARLGRARASIETI